mmetsp:Transcript_4013/g.12307  ORF Transcript_4013/g.12307 Transcript_4013/m.12307 type:complete len:224 (-) Transcript_4013:614-1285(-)
MPFDLPSNPGLFLFFSLLSIFFSIFSSAFALMFSLRFFFFAFCWSWTVFVRSLHFSMLFCFFFSSLLTDLRNSFGSSKTFSPLARFKEASQACFSATRLPSLVWSPPASAKSCSRWRALESRSFLVSFLFLPFILDVGTSSTSTLPNSKFIFGKSPSSSISSPVFFPLLLSLIASLFFASTIFFILFSLSFFSSFIFSLCSLQFFASFTFFSCSFAFLFSLES